MIDSICLIFEGAASAVRFHWRYWKGRPQNFRDLRYAVMVWEGDDVPADTRAAADHIYGPGFVSRIIDLKRRRRMAVWRVSK